MCRPILTLIFIICCKLAMGQTAEDFKEGTFTMFPIYKEDPEYFANINPDSTYLYWQCISNPGPYQNIKKEQIIFEKGDKKYAKLAKKSKGGLGKPKGGPGFTISCPPGFCSYYIIAVKPDKTVLSVNTSQKFKAFLGRIDNLDEVRLAIRDRQYTIYNNSLKSGSYQEREHDYLLFIGDIISDLIMDVKVSTRAVLTKAGDFKFIDSTTYK